jgi:hypothetical protein
MQDAAVSALLKRRKQLEHGSPKVATAVPKTCCASPPVIALPVIRSKCNLSVLFLSRAIVQYFS